MQKVIFGTVIYKQAIKFVKEFIECLSNQTTKDFDLLFINDNLTNKDISELSDKLCQNGFENRFYVIQGVSKTGCLSDFRIQLLLEAYERKYDLLIIGDIDDLFSTNRVEVITNVCLKNQNILFFYNNLIDYKGNIVLKELPKEVHTVREISQCNFLGMSNTAINLKHISKTDIESLYQGSCNIFDWYLYSRLLLLGGKGLLVEDAETIYRIYEGNIAGIQGNCIKEIEREKEIKISHYQRLEPFSEMFTIYKNEVMKIIVDETFYKTNYFNENEQGYWWNNIRLEEKDV